MMEFADHSDVFGDWWAGTPLPGDTGIASRIKEPEMTTNLKHVMPPALPEKIEEWQRFLKAERTLNDLVEDIHRMLVNDEEHGTQYRAYLRAVYDEQAVEGSLSADNTFAAIMIRDKSKTIEGSEVANEKTATISKSLAVVMRRYHASRKQRRDMLEGQIVPNENNE
jgi:hypothetical protein